MKIIFVGKNMDVANKLKERLSKKAAKLGKFFYSDTEATAVFGNIKNLHTLEFTIVHNGITFRAEERSDDMFVSIDKAVDVIERQIRKNKTRLARRIHESAFKNVDIDDLADVAEDPDFQIERTKRFHVKPMTVDEAILQMNLLGHTFFVFMNADSKQVNVVYRRKDESYGLLEPEC